MNNTTHVLADPAPAVPGAAGWTSHWPVILATTAAGYVMLCSLLRFRFEKSMRRRFGYTDRASMARMTATEAQQILQYIIQWEFPMMYKLSLQFGIFKTYGFATVSRLLMATGALTDAKMAGKRYEDTVILFSEFSLNPPTSERCLQALARMNYLHERFRRSGKILNEDLLYTLSVCVTEPERFLRLYEWRPLNEMEHCALGVFWKGIGDAMGIEYAGLLEHGHTGDWSDGLAFAADLATWAAGYERAHMLPDAINVTPSRRLVEMLLHYAPLAARPFASEVLTVLMGQRMREAFCYPEPGLVAAFTAYSALLMRRLVLRFLVLPRQSPLITLSPPDPATGRMHHGDYLIEPWYHKPTWRARWGPVALLTRALGGLVPVSGKGGLLPEGYRFEDIGPQNRMGQGVAEGAAEVERLRQTCTAGCPFA